MITKGQFVSFLTKGLCFFHSQNLEIIGATIRVDPKETGNYGKTAMDIASEKESMEVVELLWEAIGEEIPDKVKLQQLSKEMYKEDTKKAKKKFSELLGSLTPELVRV